MSQWRKSRLVQWKIKQTDEVIQLLQCLLREAALDQIQQLKGNTLM
jgi:CHASE3 domain sensor protein